MWDGTVVMEIPFKGIIRTNLVVLFYVLGEYILNHNELQWDNNNMKNIFAQKIDFMIFSINDIW